MARVDAQVENHGSIILIRPLTGAATFWLDDNVQEGAQHLGNALAVEPRCAPDILEGMRGAGLRVA